MPDLMHGAYWTALNEEEELPLYQELQATGIFPNSVIRLINPNIYKKYAKNALEYEIRLGSHVDIEMMLWHATSKTNATSIAAENFDPRRSVRSEYGYGACFSTSPRYAIAHCNPAIPPEQRVLIRARVLVGGLCLGAKHLEAAPSGYDTATDMAGLELVKFEAHEFYPELFISYNM